MLTTYTTYPDIRGALGVDDNELEDAVLSLQLYEDHLMYEFDDISYDLVSVFATTSASLTPTSAELRFLRAVRTFSTYAVAKALTGSLPMFAPKTIEDGKARVERYVDPYKATVADINTKYDKFKAALQEAFLALGEVGTTVTPRSYLSVVTPASDPILGT